MTRDETRSLDQLRVDVLCDLLPGRATPDRDHPQQGGVEITADLTTLTELWNHPGELAGYGPVIADITRQVVKDQQTSWRYTITHPTTGLPLHTGVTPRRPTTRQTRTVTARYPTPHLARLPHPRRPLRPRPHHPLGSLPHHLQPSRRCRAWAPNGNALRTLRVHIANLRRTLAYEAGTRRSPRDAMDLALRMMDRAL